MERILTWHFTNGSTDVPSYFMERDYEPVGCVIMGKQGTAEITVDILRDGGSVLNAPTYLLLNETLDDIADDFIDGVELEQGSIITCTATGNGGVNGTTVHLQIQSMNE